MADLDNEEDGAFDAAGVKLIVAKVRPHSLAPRPAATGARGQRAPRAERPPSPFLPPSPPPPPRCFSASPPACSQVCTNALLNQTFAHSKVQQWVSNIVENVLKELAVINDDASKVAGQKFKYIVTAIMQQNVGAALQGATMQYWEKATDGARRTCPPVAGTSLGPPARSPPADPRARRAQASARSSGRTRGCRCRCRSTAPRARPASSRCGMR